MWRSDRGRFATVTSPWRLLYTRGSGCHRISPQRPNRVDRRVLVPGAPASDARGWECGRSQESTFTGFVKLSRSFHNIFNLSLPVALLAEVPSVEQIASDLFGRQSAAGGLLAHRRMT